GGHQTALGLGHDLLGDHHDVTVVEPGGRSGRRGPGDLDGEIVARGDGADALDAHDLETGAAHVVVPSITTRPRAAATSGSAMTVSVTTHCMPVASTAPAASASARSITRVAASSV